MRSEILANKAAIAEICVRFGVSRLAVFGSALRDDFDPARSDIDLHVEFEPDALARGSVLERYFGFKQAMERLFRRPVDLLTRSEPRNPVLAREVAGTQLEVYAKAA